MTIAPVRPVAPRPVTDVTLRLAHQAALDHGFAIPPSAWFDQGDGTAGARDADGTLLLHTPTGSTPFVVEVTCGRHIHRTPITWPDQLDGARRAADDCTDHAPLFTVTTLAEQHTLKEHRR